MFEEKKEVVRVSVSDADKGISVEDIDRLFIPFNKLGNENIGQSGLGLGMSLVKKMIELLHVIWGWRVK